MRARTDPSPADIDLGTIGGRPLRLTLTGMIAAAAALQVVVWSLAPALLYSAPPLDVVEGYVHGPNWVLTTLKHPALPSWVLEVSRRLTGAVGWPAYVVSQLFVAATFALVYALGRQLMPPERAAAGTLLLPGVVYFAWPSIEFNHNVALMPLWAGLFYCLWRAVETERQIWWIGTSLVAAAMMYTKLSSGLALVAAAGWLVSDVKGRHALTRPAPWLAASLFVALIIPLYLSLRASNFAPLAYAASRAEAATNSGPILFVLAQGLALLGLFALLGVTTLVVRRAGAAPIGAPFTLAASDRSVRYLLAASAAPLLLVVLLATVSGAGLRTSWGAAMLSFVGLLVMTIAGPRFTRAHLRPLFWSSIGFLIIVPLIFSIVHVVRGGLEPRPSRAHWPRAEISRAMHAVWTAETGRPLRHVAGQFWGAGLVALSGRNMPAVIVDGDLASSPGISRDDLKRDGVLIVETTGSMAATQALAKLGPPSKSGQTTFLIPGARRGQSVTFTWAIIPPAP